MNVLLTSAGRRTSLLAAFRAAARRRGGQALAGDMDGLAPALYLADQAVRLPRVTHPDYLPALLAAVEGHGIRLIVPTIDTELPVLAAAAPQFARQGCVVLVSGPRLVRVAGDKWKTAGLFRACGVRVADSWLPGHLHRAELPPRLYVKPRHGSASQHNYRVHRDDLPGVLPHVPRPIIQAEVHAPEITVDALLDLAGCPVHCVPRLRLRTVGGESIQGVTIRDDDLRPWLLQVLAVVSRLGGRGPVTLQAFCTPDGPLLSEVNPRFGGGFPLTLAAGGDYPEWILTMLEGGTVQPCFGAYRCPLYMTRHYVEQFPTAPLWA